MDSKAEPSPTEQNNLVSSLDWLLETRRSSIHTRVIDDSKSPHKQSLEINSCFRALMLQLINALHETRNWLGDVYYKRIKER